MSAITGRHDAAQAYPAVKRLTGAIDEFLAVTGCVFAESALRTYREARARHASQAVRP